MIATVLLYTYDRVLVPIIHKKMLAIPMVRSMRTIQ
jgi:hypothetical protein